MTTKQFSPVSGQHILVNDSYQNPLTANWFEETYWQDKNAISGQAKGRGTTLFLRHQDDTLVLRHYKRGGLPGRLFSDQYIYTGLDATRPFEEFRLLHAMRQQGLNVPEPVAANVVKRGLVYRGDLITQMIPNSRDLHDVLCQHKITELQWQKIGSSVARMHSIGVYHHDLNVRNVMLDNEGNVWIIDFDRCCFRKGESWKKSNIQRFYRSLLKEQNKHPHFHWNSSDWDAFIFGLTKA